MRLLGPFLTLLTLSNCSALERSSLDQDLRIQGVYLCPKQKVPRPIGEDANITVTRCHQDTLTVSGDQIQWSKRIYAHSRCTGREIGVAGWVTPIPQASAASARSTQLSYGPVRDRSLTRSDYNWFMDQPMRCDLRDLPMNKAVRLDAAQEPAEEKGGADCGALYPDPVEKIRAAVFLTRGKSGASQVTLEDGVVCKR